MGDTKDHEWLVARERGEDVSHVAVATRAPYEELGKLLAKLPGMAPRAGWQQRVFEKIDAGDAVPAAAFVSPPAPAPAPATPKAALAPPKRAWQRRWIAGGAVAVAAAAAITIYLAGRPAPSQLPPPGDQLALLTTEVHDGAGKPRSNAGVRLNDRYVVRLETTGPAELRIYGDTRELLATCPGAESGCTIERDGERRRFSFEVVLHARGEVRVVAFAGARIPASTGELARDLDAATQAGVTHKMELPIVVH